MIRSEYFCPAPFVALVQDHLGQCGPCPYIGGVWDLKDVEIAERWTSPRVDVLRDKHLRGEKPSECSRCQVEDKVGMFSHRQYMLKRFADADDSIIRQTYRKGPRAMVLRLSNICNYACRTCGAMDSSLYRKEGKHYLDQYGVGSRYMAGSPVQEVSEPEMEQIAKIAGNLERLEFYGGEPLLNKSHFILLRRLVEMGRAKDVSLFYCTNGSLYPSEELLELWSHFGQQIQINFSIDAIGAGYHLVRWPGDWEKVEKILHRYDTEARQLLGERLYLGANLTISTLNVFNLPEIFKWLKDFLHEPPRTTIVHQPDYYCVRNLPDAVKAEVAQHLLASEDRAHFEGVVNFMNEIDCNPTHWAEFIAWTQRKDAYRKVNFKEVYPEYFRLLEPHWV